MLLQVYHRTRFTYPAPATESHNEVRLQPLSDSDQTCIDFQVQVEPSTQVYSYAEPGGFVHHFNVRTPHTHLEVTAESKVQTSRDNPFSSFNLIVNDWAFYERPETRHAYAEFLSSTRLVPANPDAIRIAAVARKQSGDGVASFLIALNRMLHGILVYEPGATRVDSTIEEVIANQRGVCQDFAHLMLAVCRSQGIPARYVSGYVYSGEQDMRANQATHAWVECLLPDQTWYGFDPTNNLVVNDHYIKIHVGRDYADVAPTKGIYRGLGAIEMDVEVNVTRVDSQ